jgi:hypothetical protein
MSKLKKSGEIPVYPAMQFEVDTIVEDRLVLTVHYFPTPESFQKKQSSTMRFLIPNDGALSLSGMLTRTVTESRKTNPFDRNPKQKPF